MISITTEDDGSKWVSLEDYNERFALMREMAELLEESYKIIRHHENHSLPGSAEARAIKDILTRYEEMEKGGKG